MKPRELTETEKERIVSDADIIADSLLKISNLDEETKIRVKSWIMGHIPVTIRENKTAELNHEMFVEIVTDAIKNKKGNPMMKSGTRQTGSCVIRNKRTGEVKYQEKFQMEVINGNTN